MRITGGIFKGRRLRTPAGRILRPATDKVRQAVFNIIGADRIRTAVVLDLFAGTGAYGIEALSRGAKFSYYIESDRRMCNIIKDMTSELMVKDSIDVICMDVFRAIHKIKDEGEQFDIIFADPPYRKGIVKKLIELIDRSKILKEDGIVIIEHSKDELPEEEYEWLQRWTFRKYGDTCISMYKVK